MVLGLIRSYREDLAPFPKALLACMKAARKPHARMPRESNSAPHFSGTGSPKTTWKWSTRKKRLLNDLHHHRNHSGSIDDNNNRSNFNNRKRNIKNKKQPETPESLSCSQGGPWQASQSLLRPSRPIVPVYILWQGLQYGPVYEATLHLNGAYFKINFQSPLWGLQYVKMRPTLESRICE